MKKIMKTITVIIRRIISVLKPSATINDYINDAKTVYKSMKASAWFPASSLSITLAQFNTDVMALDDAESSFNSVPPGVSKAERDAAKRVVAKDLRLLLSDVQKIADDNTESAEEIITGAGFVVKHSNAHAKFVGAKNTKVSGTILLYAPERGHHEWEQLADDGVTWIPLRAGASGKRTIVGLTPGKSYTFRSAPILPDKDGESAWTVFAAIIVT